MILGLNPGGNPDEISTSILESFKRIRDPNYNAFFEDWKNGKPHRLQKNLEDIAKCLKLDLREICATNIIFTRSKGESTINWQSLPQSLKILKAIIKIVSPEIIITFGSTPYYQLIQFFRDQGSQVQE